MEESVKPDEAGGAAVADKSGEPQLPVKVKLSEFKRDKLDTKCELCLAGKPKCTVIALGRHCFVAVAAQPAIVSQSVVVCPYAHRTSFLQCTDDEMREARAFVAALGTMYGYAMFSETVDGSGRHATLLATPLPHQMSALAPAYIRQALLELDSRVISTSRGPWGYIAPASALYVHFWLRDGDGMAAVAVPEGGFDRQVLGNMLKTDPITARRAQVYSPREETTELDAKWSAVDFTARYI